MGNFLIPSGVASTIMDFTSDLSLLLVGLVCLVGLTAGIIAWSAVRHYWSEKTSFTPRAVPISADQEEAA